MAKSKKPKAKTASKKMDEEILLIIYSLLCITLSIIGILKLGLVGVILNRAMTYMVGYLSNVVFAILILMGIEMLFKKKLIHLQARPVCGTICFMFVFLLLVAVPADITLTGFDVLQQYLANTKEIITDTVIVGVGNGGLIGALLYSLFSALFDATGTLVVTIAFFVLGLVFFSSNKYFQMFIAWIVNGVKSIIKNRQKRKEAKRIRESQAIDYDDSVLDYEEQQSRFKFEALEVDDLPVEPLSVQGSIDIQADEIVPVEENESIESEKMTEEKQSTSFLVDYAKYRCPSLSLLDAVSRNGGSKDNKKAAQEAGQKLLLILEQFGVNATLVDTHIGPSVTKFELKPDLGVKVSKISSLQNDIKLALAAKDIRIEAPIPSKSAVGIEIPNVEKTIVGLKEILRNVPEKYKNSKLLFALGKDLLGQPVYGELNKMPHLLIAGATGSGKSVCVNSIIVSLLMRARPDEVKLLLIDPKKVEFAAYQNVPHLIGPIISDGDEANNALKVIVQEMENRYDIFSKVGVRNIAGYNELVESHPEEGLSKMPWIVLIIDELADLMLVAAKEVEASIQRITQLARAAGIHLIVATQRPSVDVITGVIKSNIPSRIAFAVASSVDSRTILDQQGAEKLLGMGDMLYIPVGEQTPIRVQGVYVSDEEVSRVCDFVSQQGHPKFDDAFIRLQMVNDTVGAVGASEDPLYEEAKSFIISSQKASTSLLQRKFSIGYQRAARLIDMMETNGIVGPSRGSKPREVYMKPQESE